METVEVPTITKVPKYAEVTVIETIEGNLEAPVIEELQAPQIQTVEWIDEVAGTPSAAARAARPRRMGTSPPG